MKYSIFFVIIVVLASCSGSKNTAQTQTQPQSQGPKYTNQTTVAAPSEQQIFWDDVNALDQGVWDKLTELWGIQRGDGMWIYPLSEGEKSQFEVIKHLDPEKALPLIASWKTEVRKDERLPASATVNASTPYGDVGLSTGNGQQYGMQQGGNQQYASWPPPINIPCNGFQYCQNGQYMWSDAHPCYASTKFGAGTWQMYNGQWCYFCGGSTGVKSGTSLFNCK